MMGFNEALRRMVAESRTIRRQAWPHGLWLYIYENSTIHGSEYIYVRLMTEVEGAAVSVPYTLTFTDLAAQDWTST